jgi:hypothetical protein
MQVFNELWLTSTRRNVHSLSMADRQLNMYQKTWIIQSSLCGDQT